MSDAGVVLLGGTGQVGGALLRALAAPGGGPELLIARRAVEVPNGVQLVVLESDAPGFEAWVAAVVAAAVCAHPGLR